jgi:uncharacterized protein YceH (UPF0502 family)
VLAASDAEVQGAVDALKALSLAFESSGSRVSRYEHNMGRVLGLPSQSVALLATLMLRGPQTASELRTPASGCIASPTCRRWKAFSMSWRRGPRRRAAPWRSSCRARPGAREQRWAHQLSGPGRSQFIRRRERRRAIVPVSELAALKSRLSIAEAELDRLRGLVDRLYGELDIPR